MSAETHQQGVHRDAEAVADLVGALLGADSDDARDSGDIAERSLASCGVTDEDIDWLWETVCEEFAERTVAPPLEPGAVDLSMTISEAAAVISDLLIRPDDDDFR